MVEEDFLDDMVTWKGGLSLEKVGDYSHEIGERLEDMLEGEQQRL